MPLVKNFVVTVIPAVAGVVGQPASVTCTPKPPPTDTGGDPPTSPPPSGFVPPPGTPILLDQPGQPLVESTAPQPAGWVCRQELVTITVPGQVFPVTQTFIVCSPP